MKLTEDQVKHVAKLANLPLSSSEEEKYSEQLSGILDYIEQLNEVDTSNTEPTFNVTSLTNVMREDDPQPGLTQKEALFSSGKQSFLEEKGLSNASKKEDGMFVTKGVFEE